ncbi:hypothetical protein HYS31_07050 [Candidatus Woesearchaeota archaeon]|nr:hypothetical protein [Candidatus Woesearchaeota archaeon]
MKNSQYIATILIIFTVGVASCNYANPEGAESPQTPEIEQKDSELANKLFTDNGIPLSLLNAGELKTQITDVVTQKIDINQFPQATVSEGVHVSVQQYYKNIPLDSKKTFHFSDGRLDDFVSGNILYPQEQISSIFGKGIDKSIIAFDFSKLLSNPAITKIQAEKIASKSIKNWPDFARAYTIHLEYSTFNSDKPDGLKLVWTVKSTKNSALVVIDAQSGSILRDFDGIFT